MQVHLLQHTHRHAPFYGCGLTFVKGGVNLSQHMFLNMSCFICLRNDTAGIMSVHLGVSPSPTPPLSLMFLCWRENLVNAAASWRLTDTPACHKVPAHSERTSWAAYSPRKETSKYSVLLIKQHEIASGITMMYSFFFQSLHNCEAAGWNYGHSSLHWFRKQKPCGLH